MSSSAAEKAALPKVHPGYLVLGRKEGEKIVLTLPNGERVIIAAVENRGDNMRIGISAPRSITIAREELLH